MVLIRTLRIRIVSICPCEPVANMHMGKPLRVVLLPGAFGTPPPGFWPSPLPEAPPEAPPPSRDSAQYPWGQSAIRFQVGMKRRMLDLVTKTNTRVGSNTHVWFLFWLEGGNICFATKGRCVHKRRPAPEGWGGAGARQGGAHRPLHSIYTGSWIITLLL